MKIWTDYLVNSKYINSIYHAEKPSINEVDIHEILFQRNGPKISLTLNLKEYPSIPPKKWILQKFNTVQIRLAFIDIEHVDISGWIDTSYIASVDINKINDKIHLNINEANLKLSIKAKFMDIEDITAYIKN